MAMIDKTIYEIIGNKLRSEREKKGYSLEYVAERMNLTKKTIQRYETAESRMSMQTLNQLCNILNIKADSLLAHFVFDFSEDPSKNDYVTTEYLRGRQSVSSYPLYSHVSCGSASFVDENIEDYINLPDSLLKPNKEYFCQYAKGDSMIGENINEGDLIVFERVSTLDNGKIGCFCVDHNEATCKKYYHDNNTGIVTLQASNPNYEPIIVTVDAMNFRILGKLALIISKR